MFSAPMPIWPSGENHKITRDMYMPWVAWARTMDNGLDTVLTEAIDRGIAMYDFYAGARDATWTDCKANQASSYASAIVAAYCVDQRTSDNSSDIYGEAAGQDTRDLALVALENWKQTVRGGARTAEQIAAITSAANAANEAALVHQTASEAVYAPNPRYHNIWEYTPSNAGEPIDYKFQESWDIEPGHPDLGHFDRFYQWHTWDIFISIYEYIEDYKRPWEEPGDGEDTCWIRSGKDFTTSPDGTLILLSDSPMTTVVTHKFVLVSEEFDIWECPTEVYDGVTVFWLRASKSSVGSQPTPDPGPPLVDCRTSGGPEFQWDG
jgi:hypothetical protein